jgi:hypothetical protein
MHHLQTIPVISLIHKHKVLIKSVNVMYIKAFEYRRVQRITLDGMEHVLGITEGTKASMYICTEIDIDDCAQYIVSAPSLRPEYYTKLNNRI